MDHKEVVTQIFCALLANGEIAPAAKASEVAALIENRLKLLDEVQKEVKPKGSVSVQSLRI